MSLYMARIAGTSESVASRIRMVHSQVARSGVVSYSSGMSTIVNDPTQPLAVRIAIEREARGWSLADLAERSGVSKAMISKIERGEASPTAALLGRLSGAFGLTLSALLARAEARAGRLSRAAEQARCQDPATGYVRREVTPASAAPLELVRVELPARSCVSFPASAFTFIRQVI